MKASSNNIDAIVVCPTCHKLLERDSVSYFCKHCATHYPVKDGKTYFTEVPQDYEGSGITSTRDHATWSEWRRKNFEFYKQRLSSLSDNSSILDVGIGPGQFDELKVRFELSVGIDFRPFEPVDVVADLTKPMPFKDGVFDCVMISNTLEHLPNTEDVLAEMHRVLKPGGVLIATIPFLMRIHQKPHDFNRYTHYKLKWMLERASFSEIEVRGLSHPVDVYRTIQRHFFQYAIKARLSSNDFLNLTLKFFLRVVWRMEWALLRLLSPLYRCALPSDDFTEGYGLIGKKLK